MSALEKLIALAVLSTAMVGGYFWWEHSVRADERTLVNNEWQIKVDKLKLEAAALLAVETGKARALELQWSEFKNQQEVKDGKAQQVVAGYKSRIAGLLSGNGGRLPDPNAQTGCGGGSGTPQAQDVPGASSGAEHPTKTGGLLSEALSGLLAELTSDADQINIAYASCRADSLNLRAETALTASPAN